MQEIIMNGFPEQSFMEVFDAFVRSKTAQGVSDCTLKNYKYHIKNISKYIDASAPFEEVTKKNIEEMIVSMREKGIKQNSIATYVRMLNTFYNWCGKEGLSNLHVPKVKEKETTKDVYSDEELKRLLRKPNKNCSFVEYRSWIIVNFLMNSGCRAATVRYIQNRDVDIDSMRVVFRHNKNGKIQVIPLCSIMSSLLKDYMKIRKGKPEDYLFCDRFGSQLTEDALRHSIVKYNKSRGVESTSIHKFRHTFARKYLVDCGGNAFTLQKLLGHSTLAMTKRYCTIYDADIVKEYDMFSPLSQIEKGKQTIKIK